MKYVAVEILSDAHSILNRPRTSAFQPEIGEL